MQIHVLDTLPNDLQQLSATEMTKIGQNNPGLSFLQCTSSIAQYIGSDQIRWLDLKPDLTNVYSHRWCHALSYYYHHILVSLLYHETYHVIVM